MPLSAETTPPCPKCQSIHTERLPFTGSMVPVYTCYDCGHIWRRPMAKASSTRGPAEHKHSA
jgi:hypothetical protein